MKTMKTMNPGLLRGLIIFSILIVLNISQSESAPGEDHHHHHGSHDQVHKMSMELETNDIDDNGDNSTQAHMANDPNLVGKPAGDDSVIYIGSSIIVVLLILGAGIAVWINICVKKGRNTGRYHT